MDTIQYLQKEVAKSRTLYLEDLSSLTEVQARWKPHPEVWNIAEITEHLFWAEQAGIFGMWKTLHEIRDGNMVRSYDSIHKDLTIEAIIERTWQTKEKVPAVAAPRLGGPLVFWMSSLKSLQELLGEFCQDLKENELRVQAQPHPISGPLDFHQRIEFLRFHIDRHRNQVSELISTMTSK